MRTERPANTRRFSLALIAITTIALSAAGASLGGTAGALLAGVAAAAVGWTIERRSAARYVRRRGLLATPFPSTWEAFLRENCDHYGRLPVGLRRQFEDDLRIFVAERRITGVGVTLDDELRLLVAASAVTLSLAWPEYEWEQVTEVLLYPQDFDRDYSFDGAELAGQTHAWGTVILSVPALRQSFSDPDDGFHVGYHEFAHLLDVEGTRFDGFPVGLDPAHSREWLILVEKELERLKRGKSVLDPYGAESAVEFLAVAVETFFELALPMRERHHELYAFLKTYFCQDPAAWDDARELV